MRIRDNKGRFAPCENRICSIKNCDEEIYGIGLCAYHYRRIVAKPKDRQRRVKMTKEDKKRISDRKNKLYHEQHERYLQYAKNQRIKNPTRMRQYRLKIKMEVLTHYSNGRPKCKKCEFNDIRALCIDHVNGDGAEHRKKMCGSKRNGAGFNTYLWLRKNHYPSGFQVLCYNCNQIKECEQRDIRIIKSA